MEHVFHHSWFGHRHVDREYAGERPLMSDTVGRVLVLAVAVVLLAMGTVAVARAGVRDGLSAPVVSVLFMSHTAALGLLEVAVGALLLLGAINYEMRVI